MTLATSKVSRLAFVTTKPQPIFNSQLHLPNFTFLSAFNLPRRLTLPAFTEMTDSTSNADEDSEDEQIAMAYATSLTSNKVNMTNCYELCKKFFTIHKSIHFKVLIGFWMMSGYLDRVLSDEEAYTIGCEILNDLVYKKKILKLSDDDRRMVEFSGGNAICKHENLCITGDLGFLEMMSLSQIRKFVLPTNDAIVYRNPYLSDQIVGSKPNDRDLKYFAHFNPKPNFLKPLLESVKNPSVLLLRGVDEISSLNNDFPLEIFVTLTVLEISGSTRLRTIPKHTISQIFNLECLILSYLPIEEFPPGFFRDHGGLRRLILRGCSNLHELNLSITSYNLEVLDLSHCTSLQRLLGYVNPRTNLCTYKALQMLDLSYTRLDDHDSTISAPNLTRFYLKGSKPRLLLSQFVDLHKIQVLDLSGYEELDHLPEDILVEELQELNLSGCCRFTKLDEDLFNRMSCIVTLDLSCTKINHLPSFSNHTRLRKLSLRGLELNSIDALSSLSDSLEELDLSSLKLTSLPDYELDILQYLLSLRILNLSETSLRKLPDMSKLVRIKELILANCQHLKVLPDLSALTDLETLDLSVSNDSSTDTRQLEFEARDLPMSLRKLVLTNRSGVQKLFALTGLGNLDVLDLRGTDVVGWDSKLEEAQERIRKPVEFHIVSDYDKSDIQESDQHSSVEEKFLQGVALMLGILENFNSAMDSESQTLNMQHEMLGNDLKYIEENLDRLKISPNWNRSKELLQDLMDAADYLSKDEAALDSVNFKQLCRMVLKLKLLVPPTHTDNFQASEIIKKKKKSSFVRSQNKKSAINDEFIKECDLLHSSYRSLTPIQKNCLMCFAVFPYNEDGAVLKSLVIKKKILIYWWVGEGFIDPRHEENVDEIGKQILKVLEDKGFVEPVMKKGRESGSCCISPSVQSFVIKQAKEESFFDFNQESEELTPDFTRSRRACLLQASCDYFWGKLVHSPKRLESLRNVQTLFNVNEPVIDIKREWFSKMDNLSVLRLGNWSSETTPHVEVGDQSFLEDLAKMKQMRFLSLQGMAIITKLPDSVCRLSNLVILDLKECTYLEELPADIGSLKNLTHLDITSCPFLAKLPKGISLLSKLEVLEGFVITNNTANDLQGVNVSLLSCWRKRSENNEACNLKDLLKLECLRELSLTVNLSKFPDDDELKVFKTMKKLCKLKIVWERSIYTDPVNERATVPSRWQNKLKCWKRRQQSQIGEDADRGEMKLLDNIEKLELWCFPHENAPYWLNPVELRNLKNLYILGGSLRKLHGSGTYENKWNVETLRLKYLSKLDIQWPELKIMFPRLKYVEKYQCDQIVIFPCDDEGVWRSAI